MTKSEFLVPPPFDAERDDWGATLLAEWGATQLDAGKRVLIVGAGAGRVGLGLTQSGAAVTFADDNIVALQAARSTLAQARRTATFSTTLDLPREAEFDLALINILWWPDVRRGRELIALAAQHTRPGGMVAIGGGKKFGVLGAERHLAEVVGPTNTMIYKKGHRVIAAQRPADWHTPPAKRSTQQIEVRGQEFGVDGAAGVFAGGALDAATAMLIEALEITPTDHVLDIGCGAGIIGMVAARLAPDGFATLVDSNVVAVAVAQRNLTANAITNARALPSDGITAVRDQQFDVVATNPPFHIGRMQTNAIAHDFIERAPLVLKPHGSMYVVANRFLRYEPLLEAAFGNVHEVAGDERYKVLRAVHHR